MDGQIVNTQAAMKKAISSFSAVFVLQMVAKLVNISHRHKDTYVAFFKQENNWTIICDKAKIGLPIKDVLELFKV